MVVGESDPMARSSSTMQLTRAADYGVRVMIHMATLSDHERALLPTLARATGAPQSFLSKVLQALCRAGFLISRRGQSGGFEMLPAGRQASVRTTVLWTEAASRRTNRKRPSLMAMTAPSTSRVKGAGA